MKIIDQLKKVNLIQFVPAIFVISLVGNSVFGYTAPKSEKSKNNSEQFMNRRDFFLRQKIILKIR